MRAGPLVLSGLLAGAGVAIGLYGTDPLLNLIQRDGADAEAAPQPQSAMAVQTSSAREETISDRVEAVGTTRAVQSVDLQPQAEGLVTDFAIEAGRRVEAGTILVQLDDRAERAALKLAEAALFEARGVLDRAQQLTDQNVTSDASLESAEAAVMAAEAQVDTAQNSLADRQIVTPFAGTLGISSIERGQRLEATTVVATLDDLSQIEVTFSLPERYFGQVETGQSIFAQNLSSGERIFEGTVREIGTRVDEEARSFEVRGLIPNDDSALATGMFMNVELELGERQSLTVPEESIVSLGEATFVYVPQDGTANQREVRTGVLFDERVEILEGLDAETPVIVTGLQAVEDGAAIEIVEAAADEPAAEPTG